MNVDGSGMMNLASPDTDENVLSEDGTRWAVRDIYAEVITGRNDADIIVGYLAEPSAVPDGPVIESVFLDPAVFSRNDEFATGVMEATISDPGGLDDIRAVEVDVLLDGVSAGTGDAPVSLTARGMGDAGFTPDRVAGDGVFTVGIEATYNIAELTNVDGATIRIQVTDNDDNSLVADVFVAVTD